MRIFVLLPLLIVLGSCSKGPLSDIENEAVGEYSGVFPFLGLVEVTLHQDRTTTIINKETREKFTEKWRFDGRKLTIGSSSWWLDHDFNFTSADSPWKKLKRKIINKVKGDFRYSVRGNTITITKCNPRVSGELIIPTAIEGKAVTFIGDVAFKGCGSLTTITIPDSVTSIGDGAFAACTKLTSITIADSVTSIGGGAFYQCSGLESITVPDSVTKIEGSVFEECTSLTSIIIPDSVTSIGDYAFRECTSLTSITIGNGVTSIGHQAFARCISLTAVTFLGNAPKSGERVFSRGATPTIYRKPEAKGWGDTWGKRPVKLISEKP